MKARYTAAILSIIFVNSSCRKFLAVDPPKSQIETSVVFNKDVTATAVILGIHTQLVWSSIFNGNLDCAASLAGLSADELANSTTNSPEHAQFERNEIQPVNSKVESFWSTSYSLIYQVNAAIEGMEKSTGLSENTKKRLLGESYFVRALLNFYLVNFFGDVPLVTTTDYVQNSVVTRTPRAEVYAKIKKDLETATELLPMTYADPYQERTRPNKATAFALRARVHLYLGEWNDAVTNASAVISLDNLYRLSATEDVFLKNSSETIWSLKPERTDKPTEGRTQEGYHFSAARSVNNLCMTSSLAAAFEPGDKRKTNWTGEVVTSTKTIPHPFKYQKSSFSSELREYSMVFRLSELFLIRAEAKAQLGQLTGSGSARSDIDSIRMRSGLAATTATTLPQIMAAIEQERRVELFTEGAHRWLDLKRWHRADAVLSAFKGSTWQPADTLYPLPEIELENNYQLKPQNPGY